MDIYEASVWKIPDDNADLIRKVQAGEASLVDITNVVARPVSCGDIAASFPANGNWIAPLYAASVPGVQPTDCMSWLQAEQACALSGKRLLTNQEWQRAAAGPTEGPPCTGSSTVPTTGTDGCLSNWSANDMGNWWEWVGDWTDLATRIAGDCAYWLYPYWGLSCVGGPGGHHSKLAGDSSLPGARHRGAWDGILSPSTWDGSSEKPGIFTISDGDVTTNRGYPPWQSVIAFRCAR